MSLQEATALDAVHSATDDPPIAHDQGADLPPRVRSAVLGLLAVLTVLSTIGAALSPYLLVAHPLWLVALNADGRHIVLAAAEAPIVPLVLIGTARRTLSLLLTYGLGAIYGDAVLAWVEKRFRRTAGVIRAFEALLHRLGPAVLVPLPGYTPTLLAGVSRLALAPVALALTVGTLLWTMLTVAFGDALKGTTGGFVAWVGENVVACTIAAIVLVAAWQIWGRLKGRSPWRPPMDVS